MPRPFVMIYAAICYAAFFALFLLFLGFVGNFPMLPFTVDRGPIAHIGVALATDVGLIGLFGIQHSLMARKSFKAAWTRIIPPEMERSTYVLSSSLVLLVLMLLWRPVPAYVWHVEMPVLVAGLQALFALGWLLVLFSTFLINHFELFGLHQAWAHWRGKEMPHPKLRQPLLYKIVRHPLYLGFFIAIWATPYMSVGHLVLAAGLSSYMLVAIPMEERDLVDVFGKDYEDYRNRVGMITPRLWGKG
ncbi:methanethiol S-methyltransferase [Croceicoccus mobilis]|uniref:methanethiol S-methyltransferase n=1 Tax=Croceicoccus mobilis TaxID=1703339 RepID=A0A916Z6A9_9SPHN|nr:methanethiol S-methyltransferase [Croceicoccus mobilis]GGD78484.1 membrane protein [Croceicoccus mobilis]